MRRKVLIRETVRGTVPRIPFERVARSIFATDYELSLVVCGDALARRMNRTYRKKSYAANVLSFPLDKNTGEIFLNVRAAAREAKRFNITLKERLTLLFVHGCFHLKGMGHGSRMEKAEERVLRKFR